jgi:hypothetical protein
VEQASSLLTGKMPIPQHLIFNFNQPLTAKQQFVRMFIATSIVGLMLSSLRNSSQFITKVNCVIALK